MGLVKDMSRAQTHFMAVTLRRTASHNPRTFYTLVDYEIIPFSWIEEAWANRVSALDESPCSPQAILARDAAERKKNDGALGSVLVISLELPPGDDRSPREALKNVCRLDSFQSKVHSGLIMHPTDQRSCHATARSLQCAQGQGCFIRECEIIVRYFGLRLNMQCVAGRFARFIPCGVSQELFERRCILYAICALPPVANGLVRTLSIHHKPERDHAPSVVNHDS